MECKINVWCLYFINSIEQNTKEKDNIYYRFGIMTFNLFLAAINKVLSFNIRKCLIMNSIICCNNSYIAENMYAEGKRLIFFLQC